MYRFGYDLSVVALDTSFVLFRTDQTSCPGTLRRIFSMHFYVYAVALYLTLFDDVAIRSQASKMAF